MATVYRRGSTWTAQWYRGSERIAKSTGLTGKREAQKRADEMEVEDRKAQHQDPVSQGQFQRILTRAAEDAKAGKLTTKQAEEYLLAIRRAGDDSFQLVTVKTQLESWVTSQKKRVGPSTAKGYGEMQTAALAALGKKAGIPISDLTHDDCEKLIHDLKTPKRTAATANQHFRAFRRALQSAVTAQVISSNPAQGIPPLPETDSTEKQPFTLDEVQQMITHDQTSEEWRGAILIAAHTGLRLGDVVQLASSHVHGLRIIIRPKKTERSKKTLTVPLSAPVQAWIKDKQGAFFPTLSTAPKSTLSTQFKRIMKRSGITLTKAKTFHSLRHTFTSWLANAEVPQDVRQKLTGHSDSGIHSLYTHHDTALDNAISKLPDLQISRDYAKSTDSQPIA